MVVVQTRVWRLRSLKGWLSLFLYRLCFDQKISQHINGNGIGCQEVAQ